MTAAEKCAAVIPCLNEAEAIHRVVAGTRRFIPRVYVVDDGSSDGTAARARAAGAIVLEHPASCGKGAALKTGFARAREDGFAAAACLDGDGQHDPADLPRFFAAFARGADLVVGNRMGAARRMPFLRRWVNRWMSRRVSLLAGIHLPDSQCGFRMLNLAEYTRMEFACAHFDFESELLVQFARAGRRIEFVPAAAIYRGERSKIRPLADTIRWLRWWRRMRQPASRGAAGAPLLKHPLPQRAPSL